MSWFTSIFLVTALAILYFCIKFIKQWIARIINKQPLPQVYIRPWLAARTFLAWLLLIICILLIMAGSHPAHIDTTGYPPSQLVGLALGRLGGAIIKLGGTALSIRWVRELSRERRARTIHDSPLPS